MLVRRWRFKEAQMASAAAITSRRSNHEPPPVFLYLLLNPMCPRLTHSRANARSSRTSGKRQHQARVHVRRGKEAHTREVLN